MLPNTVSLANTLSIYPAVCSPGLIPGIYAPDLFKLSDTSLVLKVNASHMKQNEIINAAKVRTSYFRCIDTVSYTHLTLPTILLV